jgi:phosphatidylglycerophosphatase A
VSGEPQAPARPPLGLEERFMLAIATGLGSGYSPIASGTAGTLVAIPLYLAVCRLAPWLQLLTIGALIGVAVQSAAVAGRHFGETDDGRIVIDEVAGYLVTMALVPPSVLSVAVGFFLFRAADIVKPWPASYFDRKVHSGFGTVMDDVVAALYARAAVAAVLAFWPW